jgi:hypothetical protein
MTESVALETRKHTGKTAQTVTTRTTVLLASARYNLDKGTSKTIDLAPTIRGLALLKAATGKTPLHVSLTATVQHASTVHKTAVVT